MTLLVFFSIKVQKLEPFATLILVVTTFVRIETPAISPWEYYNVNKNARGVTYQIGASLGTPFRFVHFDGPFKGSAADVSILRSTIVPLLDDNEQVMCDKGYRQEEKCWCPPARKVATLSNEDKIKRREVTRIRQFNESYMSISFLWSV